VLDLDGAIVARALEAGWITERDERAAQRAVAKARKRGKALYVAQALVQRRALDCQQLLELGRQVDARLYECPNCGHKMSSKDLPQNGDGFACTRCEHELEADHAQTLSLAEVLTSRDPLDLSVTLRDKDPREASTSASSSLPPFDLARFELQEELGRGAYGVVFRAMQTDLQREVALKVLRPRDGELSTVELERFLREGASVARLQHPNVVKVFGIGRHKDLYVLSMELVKGQSLKAFRKAQPEGRLPWREAVQIVLGVLAGVEHAHKHGIVHRDLKPANVLIEGDATPRVIDFGLAKDLETDLNLTQGSAAVGSPAYLSPEQLKHGSKTADERCDVFSVGVMLYELLAGTRPWTAKTRNDLFLTMLRDAPIPLPEELELPDGLADAVMRLLAQDPATRTPTARAARKALQEVLDGKAQAASARPARTRRGTKATRSVGRPEPATSPPLGLILGGVGLLAALGVALALGGGGSPSEETPPLASAAVDEVEAQDAQPEPAEPKPEPVVAEPVEPKPEPAAPEPEPDPLEPAPQEPDPQPAEPEPQEPESEPREPQAVEPAEPKPERPQPEPQEPAEPQEALYAVVRGAPALNLRAGPGRSNRVLRVAQEGEWLRASGQESNGWLELILDDETRAWASASFLEQKRVPLARDPARPELDTGADDAKRFPRLAAHDDEQPWFERAFLINRLEQGALTPHVLCGLRLALRDPWLLNRAFALRGLRRFPRELLLGVGSQGLFEGLVEQLERREEPFVPAVAQDLLGRMAADGRTRSADAWRAWWAAEGEAEARRLSKAPLPQLALADGGAEATRVRELSTVVSEVRKQGLQIVFVLDVTASMGEELKQVKAQIREIVSLLSLLLHENPKKLRFGLVTYGDEIFDFERLGPFTRFPEKLDKVVIHDVASDRSVEEAISLGLIAAFDKRRMKWGSSRSRRVVLLLADAPPLDPDTCRKIAKEAHEARYVLSTLIAEPPAKYAQRFPPEAILTELAQLGGGTAAKLDTPENLLVHILTLSFGPSYEPDLRLLVRAYREVRPQREGAR